MPKKKVTWKSIVEQAAADLLKGIPEGSQIRSRDFERNVYALAIVRAKGAQKGWSEAQINRRYRARVGSRQAFKFVKKVFQNVPGGSVLIAAGDSVEGIANKIVDRKAPKWLTQK